jgi:hypothetical protein
LTTFAPIFVPAELRHATSDTAWLSAMLDAERALALAESVDLSPAELDAASDPSGYLGSAPALVAAVLSRYQSIFERVP